ncbi:hypothetical protein ACP3A9_000144 [Citrobacter amalonaticus]
MGKYTIKLNGGPYDNKAIDSSDITVFGSQPFNPEDHKKISFTKDNSPKAHYTLREVIEDKVAIYQYEIDG